MTRHILVWILLFAFGGWAGCASDTSDDDSAATDDDVSDDDASDDDAADDDASDDDTGDDDTTPVEDDAEVVSVDLPTAMTCGETYAATVEMRNTGLATWTAEEGYKLGAVDDEDPFHGHGTRVYLPDDAAVAPGESHVFSLDLLAPMEAGDLVTDWRMVHEAVHWFGDTAAQTVTVSCTWQTFTDPLTDASVQPGFDEKVADGGTFSADGWQTTGGWDQLRLRLTTPIQGDGSFEIDVTNLDPATQYSNTKHQIINMYTSADGSQAVFDTDEAWWNIRTGTNYYTGFKFLASARGGDEREEHRLMESATWDPADVHTFRVEWDSVDIDIYLDGTYLHTLEFDGRIEPLQHVFLGRDNVYVGQAGPIFSNLRITYEP